MNIGKSLNRCSPCAASDQLDVRCGSGMLFIAGTLNATNTWDQSLQECRKHNASLPEFFRIGETNASCLVDFILSLDQLIGFPSKMNIWTLRCLGNEYCDHITVDRSSSTASNGLKGLVRKTNSILFGPTVCEQGMSLD